MAPSTRLTTDRITFTAADAVAGLAGPPTVELTSPVLGGPPIVLQTTITCDSDERRTCNGEVPPPLIRGNGPYDVRVRANDRAGRTTLSPPVRVTIVNPVRASAATPLAQLQVP